MIVKVKERIISWYESYVSYLTVTPVLVTLAIITASVIVGSAMSRNLDTVQSQAVDKQMRENSLLIQSTFSSYEQIVLSQVGRINSAPLDRTMWKQFVDSYQLEKKFPAISRLAVTRELQPDEKEAYIAELSTQFNRPIQIINDTPNKPVDILAYSSPESDSTLNNIGFNLLSEPNRARAIQRSTNINDVAMTDQTRLLGDTSNERTQENTAFIMYAPYYKQGLPIATAEQRREAVQGHVFASFKTNEVFKQIFDRVDKTHLAISVSAKSDDSNETVYWSKTSPQINSKITRHQTVSVFGQAFSINYEFDRSYLVSTTQLNAPLYTAIFGSLVGLLVGTVTFFFLRGRYHQILLDKERDIARAKDELLSLASHQLRTPATGVKQYMGMVLQGFAGPISQVQEEMLDKAYKSNERQLGVINDILHLAKLDLGRIVLAKTEFDLAELVNDVVEEQEADIRAAELSIDMKITKKALIYADKHMLRMVVENLVSNAVKYTDPGGKIVVRLRAGDGGYYISVRDTGVGIAQNDIQQLFKQFSRLQNKRSHLVTGTGVGLYLAKHLIKLHDGDIDVESKLGKGSTFTLFVPKKT